MGGAHTLDIAFTKLGDFSYVGVFSSGVFGIDRPESNGAAEWMDKHKECLTNADLKNGLQLVWFATGRDDFLLKTTESTVDALKKKHVLWWSTRRPTEAIVLKALLTRKRDLNEFAPLFQ